jgi:hypothetical protein
LDAFTQTEHSFLINTVTLFRFVAPLRHSSPHCSFQYNPSQLAQAFLRHRKIAGGRKREKMALSFLCHEKFKEGTGGVNGDGEEGTEASR